MSIRCVRDPEQPDAVLRDRPPKDHNGELMQAGRRYLIGKDRKLCFEDPETGELFYQSIDPIGTVKQRNGVPVRPVPLLSMPTGNYTVYRLEDEE